MAEISERKMHETFVNIRGVPTHIFRWGPWIEDSFNEKEVILCITGNPGLAGFYTLFLSTVHETLGKDIPVWVIGHAGHNEPSNNPQSVPSLEGNEHLYSLDGQVQHKVEFIRKYIPSDVKIHLVCHSIGSWVALELLKVPDINSRIHKCYMLFPTFERMAESPNGWIYTKLFQRGWPLIFYLPIIFSYLPTILRVCFIYLYFFIFSIPSYFVGTALKYIRPPVIRKIVFLADEEMERVVEADYDHIERNKNRLKLYYGATDGWTPIHYCKQLKERIADIDAQVDVNGYAHAFVLRSSVEMGKLVAGWIAENRAT